HHKENAVRPLPRNGYCRQVERLRVDEAVYRKRKELAEGIDAHPRGSELLLLRVQRSARVVVVVGGDLRVGRGGRPRSDCEEQSEKETGTHGVPPAERERQGQ